MVLALQSRKTDADPATSRRKVAGVSNVLAQAPPAQQPQSSDANAHGNDDGTGLKREGS